MTVSPADPPSKLLKSESYLRRRTPGVLTTLPPREGALVLDPQTFETMSSFLYTTTLSSVGRTHC
jgi:hypothetical protein